MRDTQTNPEGRARSGISRANGLAVGAFTLIELLVAVTVLVIITLLLARIINQSNNVISEGTRQATQNANARMALDFIAKDFLQAAGDGRLRFQRDESPGSPATPNAYGATYPCHSLKFFSFRNILEPGDTGQDREAVRVAYYVKDMYATFGCYSLMRAEKPVGATESYTNLTYNPTVSDEAELIRYVVEFRAVCYQTNSYAVLSAGDTANMDHLPAYIDIFLAVLSEAEARRAHSMPPGSADQINFISRTAKRYHTRCWSLNSTAYINGR